MTTEHTMRSAPVADQAPVRLRVDLAYDGAPFHGLARQPGLTTVQGSVEDALEAILGVPVRTTASGRTDRGVHARAQVMHGDVPEWALGMLPRLGGGGEASLAAALSDALPASITIHSVRRVPSTFDARFSATSRAYRFRLQDGVDPRAQGRGVARDAPDVWGITDRLDVAAMRRASRALVGEHDFAAFCRRAPGRTTVRRIDLLTLRRIGTGPGRIDIRLEGRAFCHQQVRSIVGCLVDVGRGRREERWIADVLSSRDRSLASPVAPPHGLTLEAVRFGPGTPASPPRGAAPWSGPGARRAAGTGARRAAGTGARPEGGPGTPPGAGLGAG
jgi:tRNA pseudouridine38-40 synthase